MGYHAFELLLELLAEEGEEPLSAGGDALA